ncbi:MAG: hypothetical protein L6V93_02195 [Clostridiales bacterium]|nr:MAG: hypothetical protein L6V93_02195 [Clostridiales bacterium]
MARAGQTHLFRHAFYSYDKVDTTVTGATKNLLNYNWTNDRRTVTFPDKNYYTITALADDGGTVTGGGTIVESSSITLTAAANDGYTFAGWYDGDTKVCDTAEFTVENVTEDKNLHGEICKRTPYPTQLQQNPARKAVRYRAAEK